ncbi:hypothetical protein GCM10027454_20240 [Algoriphagus aestuariicola]
MWIGLDWEIIWEISEFCAHLRSPKCPLFVAQPVSKLLNPPCTKAQFDDWAFLWENGIGAGARLRNYFENILLETIDG